MTLLFGELTIRHMVTFCASCARETVGGPVMRGGWLYCSISCAREPGASNRAWHGRLQLGGEDRLFEKAGQVERLSAVAPATRPLL